MAEAEEQLWEAETKNLTAVASKGKVIDARYRITNHALYIQRGVMSLSARRVPMSSITDVSVNQTMMQKRRRVGDVVVRHRGDTGLASIVTLDSIVDPQHVADLIDQHARYQGQRVQRAGRTFYSGQ